MNQNMPVELYTDGSCINNPGPGGIGYIIRYPAEVDGQIQSQTIERSKGFRLTTNNRMEILAGIEGLADVQAAIGNGTIKGCSSVILFSDSEYFCNAVNKQWIDKWQQNNWVTSAQTPVKNKDLWERVIITLGKVRGMGIYVQLQHIPGHKGHEFNERTDVLAKGAAKGTDLLIDEVYESTNKR